MVELYDNIKKRRIELNMTQSELASKVGYSDKGMISKVENGKVDIPQSLVLKFAKALDTTPSCLMGWDYSQENKDEALNDYARKLYEYYQQASPEIQKAVDLLLKAGK